MQPERIMAKLQHTYDTLNFPIFRLDSTTISRSKLEESIESTEMTISNETTSQSADVLNEIGNVDGVLYMYGTPPLIFFCIISIAINIKVLMSAFWIRRPLSPTLYISLSLTGIAINL